MKKTKSNWVFGVVGVYVLAMLFMVFPSAASAQVAGSGRFQAVDDKIYDPYGQEFIPVGGNLLGPNDMDAIQANREFGMYDHTGSNGEIDALTMSDEVQSWNWNTVRLNMCQDKYCLDKTKRIYTNPDFVSRLDAIVSEYTDKRLVVILELHELTGDMLTTAERDALLDFWQWAADRYKANSYVWFNVANEPGPDHSPTTNTYDVWEQLHDDAINRIRAESADNIVVIDGTWFGQDRDWTVPVAQLCTSIPSGESAVLGRGSNLLSGNTNIVFSLHVYEMWGKSNCTAQQHRDILTDYVNGVRALGAPLIVGETGFELSPDSERLAASQALYAIAQDLKLGVLAWGAQDGNTPPNTGAFGLVQTGNFYNLGSGNSNLSVFGQLHWDYSQVLGAAIQVPSGGSAGGGSSGSDAGGAAGELADTGQPMSLAAVAVLVATGLLARSSVVRRTYKAYRKY